MTSIYSLSVTQNWRELWISLEFEIEFVEPMAGVPWWWPSLASLTQSSWSLLSNALGGQDCIRLGPMAGVPWWWRRPRWMGDGGAWFKKNQQPSSTVECLKALSETDRDEDGLVFRKREVAPPSDETIVPQMKNIKWTQQAPPPPTQPHTSKLEKRSAQRTKHPTGK